MAHTIPIATAPPRHQSTILTPTRRTAGPPLLAAKVGATQVGKPVGRVAMVDKLPLHLLGLLDLHLLARPLHQQRTAGPQLPVKTPPARAAEVKAAVQEAGPISSLPTLPPVPASPVPTAQEQVKEVARISSIPTTPLRKSLQTRASPGRVRATTPTTNNSHVGH